MNLNGIPEIVIADFGCGGMGAGQCRDVSIYEWDGIQFASLFSNEDGREWGVSMIGGRMKEYLPNVEIKDMDNNGTLELMLTGGIPNMWYQEYFDYYPWRDKNDIYVWDGHHFVLYKTEYSAPMYRYQAVQDGDRAMLLREYDQALTFYQEAIFNKDLLGWSPAHKERSILLDKFTWDSEYRLTPTPTIPPDDSLEYPNLAAYARYRIMLLHLIQGNWQEAQVVYETLQEKFPEGSSGYEFTLIASAIWDEYQVSKDIKSACAIGISVAKKHSEVLKFLGSDYHNIDQDIMYKPKDICPFK
jgi:tetratricopeptide (TPR) repeat protein